MKIKQALNNIRNNIFNIFYLKGNDQFPQDFFVQKVTSLIFKIKLSIKF